MRSEPKSAGSPPARGADIRFRTEEDLPKALDRLFPRHGEGIEYGHQRMWQDGNGHSHVRAAFLGPSITLPVIDGKPVLGTWQQIVFVELDNKPRDRRVVVQVVGT